MISNFEEKEDSFNSRNSFPFSNDTPGFFCTENDILYFERINNDLSCTFSTNFDTKEKKKEIKMTKKISKNKISIPNKTKKSRKKTNKKKTIYNSKMRKEVIKILINNVLIFINGKIKDFYNGNKKGGISIKELKPVKYDIKKIENNKNFLYTTVGDFYSRKIKGYYTNLDCELHNKDLINEILNKEYNEKQNYFQKLFNLTFLQCLEHFRGTKFNELLDKMKKYEDEILKYPDEKDFKEELKVYIFNYENILKRKRSRNIQRETKIN